MITEITRGHIRLQFGNRVVTVQGEGYARGYGAPDFVVYKNSIQRWDPPYDNTLLDEDTKDQILAVVTAEMAKKGMTIEIE
jgi:hypothetical protein